MGTYSFINVNATLSGLGGVVALGYSAGAAKEGITTEMIDDKDRMEVGADGTIMHSLRASNAARITVRLLKTSPANALLSNMYNIQRLTPSGWGQNLLGVTDVQRGDVLTGSLIAFARQPMITWAEDANHNEWIFFGQIEEILGAGIPDVN